MSDDVLELLSGAPEPVMRVDPHQVIAGGRRTRRRRHTRTAIAATAAGVAVAFGVAASLFPTGSRPAQDLAPAGPTQSAVHTDPPRTATPHPSLSTHSTMTPAWGAVHVMSPQRTRAGRRPALYVTRSRMLCIGTVDAQVDVTPSVCRDIKTAPSNAFGVGYAWSMDGDLPTGIDAHEIVAGVVAPDVTRVVVRTEKGDLDAHLAQAPDPAMGQLYWVETGVPILDAPKHAKDRSRVAYRGSKVAFTCSYYACVREDGTPAPAS